MRYTIFAAAAALGCSASALAGPLAYDVEASVNMSSRWYNDADDALNAPNLWPGSVVQLGSGPGDIEGRLRARVFDLGALLDDRSFSQSYDDDANAFIFNQGVGAHKFPAAIRSDVAWDPNNPALTVLATSDLDWRSERWSNEFGERAAQQSGVAASFAGVKRFPERFKDARSSGRFIDTMTIRDGSGADGLGQRIRRFVKESWGAVSSSTFDPFGALPEASWTNTLTIDARSEASSAMFLSVVEEEAWMTRGVATVAIDQGRRGNMEYPGPLMSSSLEDPSEYVATLSLRGLIIDPDDVPRLEENHEATVSTNTLYHDQGEILPPDQPRSFAGSAGIFNGDFFATGDFANLDWDFQVVASDHVPGFEELIATTTLQTPWALNIDFDTLFGGDPYSMDLEVEQRWSSLAPIPAPAAAPALLATLWLARRRRS